MTYNKNQYHLYSFHFVVPCLLYLVHASHGSTSESQQYYLNDTKFAYLRLPYLTICSLHNSLTKESSPWTNFTFHSPTIVQFDFLSYSGPTIPTLLFFASTAPEKSQHKLRHTTNILPRRQFILVYLVQSVITVEIDFGGAPNSRFTISHSGTVNLSDSLWHRLRIAITEQAAFVTLDGKQLRQGASVPFFETTTDVLKFSDVYVGGLPGWLDEWSVEWAATLSHFLGRLRNIVVQQCHEPVPRLMQTSEISEIGVTVTGKYNENPCSSGWDNNADANVCGISGVCLASETNGSEVFKCDCSFSLGKMDFSKENDNQCIQTSKSPTTTMTGSSFISNNLRNSPLTTASDAIQMQIKTKQPSAFLFYSEGNQGNGNALTSFLKVSLYQGSLSVLVLVDDSVYNATVGPPLNDNMWHSVAVHRRVTRPDKNEGVLTVRIFIDNQLVKEGSIHHSGFLIWNRHITLGGGPTTLQQIDENNTAISAPFLFFRGCIRNAIYTAENIKLDILAMTKNSLHGFKTVSHVKQPSIVSSTGVDFSGCKPELLYQPITFRHADAFLIFPLAPDTVSTPRQHFTISFRFRTLESNALLLYILGNKEHILNNSAAATKSQHFIAFELRWGKLILIHNFGNDVKIDSLTKFSVSDSHEHFVVLSCAELSSKLEVQVDELETTFIEIEGILYTGTLSNERKPHVFIGSMSEAHRQRLSPPYQLWSLVARRGFIGCLSDLEINGQQIDLVAMVTTKNDMSQMVVGCRPRGGGPSGLCDLNGYVMSDQQAKIEVKEDVPGESVCQSGGRCREGWMDAICDCTNTSYTGPLCDQAAPVVHFNGSQFVSVDLGREHHTEIESLILRFQTNESEGLLFRTTSPRSSAKDLMELQLVDGCVRLILNLGGGTKIYKMTERVNDNKWHLVKILREHTSLTTQLDSTTKFYEIFSKATLLNLRRITTGMLNDPSAPSAAGDTSTTRDGSQRAFVGRMMHFTFNGLNYFEHSTLPNIEATARLEKRSPRLSSLPSKEDSKKETDSTTVTFQTASCYISMQPLSLYGSFVFTLTFKTTQPSGLLLINWGKSSGDYFLLELVNGRLELAFNMGRGIQRKRSAVTGLADDRWHQVEVKRIEDKTNKKEKNIVEFRVDKTPLDRRDAGVEVIEGDRARNFNLDEKAFVGGLPPDQLDKWRQRVNSRHGFQGCLANMSINYRPPFALLERRGSQVPQYCSNQVSSGCSKPLEVCSPQRCYNGGQCIQQWSQTKCNCEMTTYTGDKCETVGTTIQFGESISPVGYARLSYMDRVRNTTKDEMAMGVETSSTEGTLLFVQAASTSGDFLHIFLDAGHLTVQYNMGGATHTVSTSPSLVSDGFYHRVIVVRRGKSISVKLDQTEWTLEPKGNHGTHFNEQKRLWIGFLPSMKTNKHFRGNISGVFFNRVPVSDLIAGLLERSFIEVTKFGMVKYLETYQPLLPRSSFENSNEMPNIAKDSAPDAKPSSKSRDIVVPREKCIPENPTSQIDCTPNSGKSQGIVNGKVNIIYPDITLPPSQVRPPPHTPNDDSTRGLGKPSSSDASIWSEEKSIITPIPYPPRRSSNNRDKLGKGGGTPLLQLINNIGIWLIMGLICTSCVVLVLLICIVYRCRRSRHAGSYNLQLYSPGHDPLKASPSGKLPPDSNMSDTMTPLYVTGGDPDLCQLTPLGYLTTPNGGLNGGTRDTMSDLGGTLQSNGTMNSGASGLEKSKKKKSDSKKQGAKKDMKEWYV